MFRGLRPIFPLNIASDGQLPARNKACLPSVSDLKNYVSLALIGKRVTNALFYYSLTDT